MRLRRPTLRVATAAVATAAALAVVGWEAPAPASASIPKSLCKLAHDANGLAGKACDALSDPKRLVNIGKNLITGHLGTALKDFLGNGGPSSASAAVGLAALVAWVVEGARAAVHGLGKVISETAAPQLTSVWFSSRYWRMAALAALLTLPFLFAAAVQAVLRSDLSLLSRAAFGDLPLALLAVGIAAPLAMLLLSATDELCALVWSPSSTNGLGNLLGGTSAAYAIVRSLGSPFLAFLVCFFTAAAGVLVWLELAMREAAVYIVVLMLPLAFAALVWPARRVWAIRAVEVLVALILSKFAIVAVLGLGGAALDHPLGHGVAILLAGMVLVLLAAFAPWALLRLLPLTELASGAASALRPQLQAAIDSRKATEARLAGATGHIMELVNFSSNGRPDLNSNGGRSRSNAVRDASPGHAASAAHHDRSVNGFGATGADTESGDQEAGAQTADADLATNVAPADLWGANQQRDASGGRRRAADGVSGRAPTNVDPAQVTPAEEERVPGADPMWQAPDMTWRPMTLGYEGWPPEPPWPAEEKAPGIEGGTEPPQPDARPEGSPQEQPDALAPEDDRGGPL